MYKVQYHPQVIIAKILTMNCTLQITALIFEQDMDVDAVMVLLLQYWEIYTFAIFFGFLATFIRQLFFTDFVADVIYGGDVTAPENSTVCQKNTKGVKVRSLDFKVSVISSLAISLLLGPLTKLFGIKLVLVSSCVLSLLQTGVIIFVTI